MRNSETVRNSEPMRIVTQANSHSIEKERRREERDQERQVKIAKEGERQAETQAKKRRRGRGGGTTREIYRQRPGEAEPVNHEFLRCGGGSS